MTYPPGVHRVAAPHPGNAVPPVASKAEFLAALAQALEFPPWAGHNWDATADLLADLSWLEDPHPVLVWTAPEVLAAADPDAYAMALDVLAAAGTARGLVTLLVPG